VTGDAAGKLRRPPRPRQQGKWDAGIDMLKACWALLSLEDVGAADLSVASSSTVRVMFLQSSCRASSGRHAVKSPSSGG
jgi:hypothetical protein